jgi:hypothetical protein
MGGGRSRSGSAVASKRVVKRLVRVMPGHAVRCDYLAHYDMGHSTAEKRAPSWRRLLPAERNGCLPV